VEKDGMNQAHSKLERVRLWLEVFALGFGILAGIAGSIIGLVAWTESREANRLNIDTQQGTEDTKLYEFLLADPSLSGLFVEFKSETNVLTVANKKILLLLSTNNAEFSMFCEKATNPVPWKTVQELNDYLWNGKDFYDEKQIRLRKAYNLMEWISGQAEYAFEANRRGQLAKGDFQSWIAWIDLLATHPLFLASLQDEHDYDFPSKGYCAFLRQRVLAQPQGRELLANIYSNMLDSAWIDSVGCATPH
jgi:hypothetical protein